jgi:hypothetical protein
MEMIGCNLRLRIPFPPSRKYGGTRRGQRGRKKEEKEEKLEELRFLFGVIPSLRSFSLIN